MYGYMIDPLNHAILKLGFTISLNNIMNITLLPENLIWLYW